MKVKSLFSGGGDKATSNSITHIAEGTSLGGDLVSSAPIYFFGSISGDLCSDGDIFVGDNAEVLGDIKAPNLYLGGKVRGDIQCENFVYLKSSAVVAGNLFCKEINIERGALVAGYLRVSSEKFVTEKFDKNSQIEEVNSIPQDLLESLPLEKNQLQGLPESSEKPQKDNIPHGSNLSGVSRRNVKKPVNSDVVIDRPTEEKQAVKEPFRKNLW